MKKILIGIVLGVSPFFAIAEPIYLECSGTLADDPAKFEIKLDEESGKITHNNANGSGFNSEGFFSSEEVAYKQVRASDGIMVSHQINVSRVDLSYSADMHMYSIEYPDQISEHLLGKGKCVVKKVKKRAF